MTIEYFQHNAAYMYRAGFTCWSYSWDEFDGNSFRLRRKIRKMLKVCPFTSKVIYNSRGFVMYFDN